VASPSTDTAAQLGPPPKIPVTVTWRTSPPELDVDAEERGHAVAGRTGAALEVVRGADHLGALLPAEEHQDGRQHQADDLADDLLDHDGEQDADHGDRDEHPQRDGLDGVQVHAGRVPGRVVQNGETSR
jgi:hypothetical protein